MILLKAAMMQKGEEFHITVWPGARSRQRQTHLLDPETDPYGGSCMIYPTIQSYAIDSQAFVLSSNGILREGDFPEKWRYLTQDNHTNYGWMVGGSAIVNPSGLLISGPSFGEETILYAECEANQIKLSKALMDCLGHYARWDVVRIQVRQGPWIPEIGMENYETCNPSGSEIRNIAERYNISVNKLLDIIQEVNNIRTRRED